MFFKFVLQRDFKIETRRRIRRQRRSSKCWLRTWGALQGWMFRLYLVIASITEGFEQFTVIVVIVNAGAMVAGTFKTLSETGASFLSDLDEVFMGIFIVECVLKLLVSGPLYFKNAWNDLEFAILVMNLIDFLVPIFEARAAFGGSQAPKALRMLRTFKGFRALRVFRVLHTFSFCQSIQSIISTCSESFHSMGAIGCITGIVFMMFAAIFREMFSKSDPQRFGNMFQTLFTLFQVLTLDDWSLIYKTSKDNGAPHIIIFLVMFIVVEYMIFLQLCIAVFTDNFRMKIKKEAASEIKAFQDDHSKIMKALELRFLPPQSEKEFYEEALKKAYSGKKCENREIEIITSYLRILAAMDQKQQTFLSQGCLLEHIFDTFFEATEETILLKEHE